MDLDALLIARLQFAFTIIWHIIFPAFTIGLSAYIATLCVMWMHTGKAHYRELARFWTKIFAAAFAMGVVSGLVLTYQFGTNWSRYSAVLGNVVGPMIGYEVEVAFFLEATFLGVLLFGWERMPPWLHTLAAVAVAGGTLLSAFWILSANSWMQTPVGYEMRDGVAYPLDWLDIVFNPSFPYRLAHMVTAAYLTTSFVVLAVGARYVLAGKHMEHGQTMVRMAVAFAAIAAPLQLFIGDQHGLNTLKHQPTKIAAIEAHWDGSTPGELVLFAWPDESAETNRFALTIPHGASLLLTHSWDGLFPGLKNFAPNDRPPVLPPFFAFRAMVGIGLLMIRRDLRLDRHRDRPAAVGRIRGFQNRRCGVAGRGRQHGDNAGVVRAGLRRRGVARPLLHQSTDRARTATLGDRAAHHRRADACAAGRGFGRHKTILDSEVRVNA